MDGASAQEVLYPLFVEAQRHECWVCAAVLVEVVWAFQFELIFFFFLEANLEM